MPFIPFHIPHQPIGLLTKNLPSANINRMLKVLEGYRPGQLPISDQHLEEALRIEFGLVLVSDGGDGSKGPDLAWTIIDNLRHSVWGRERVDNMTIKLMPEMEQMRHPKPNQA